MVDREVVTRLSKLIQREIAQARTIRALSQLYRAGQEAKRLSGAAKEAAKGERAWTTLGRRKA